MIFLISNRWAAEHGAKTNKKTKKKPKAWKLDNLGFKTRICVTRTSEKYAKACEDKTK